MEAGEPGVALGLALSVAEESHLCRFVQVLSTGQTWLKVEETEEQHTEAEGVEGIAGRSHFRIGPARKKEKKHCDKSRRLSAGGRTRRTISGLEFLLAWPEA
jgi:hypothetical protein